jgi:lysophospholipase L1-like esterase
MNQVAYKSIVVMIAILTIATTIVSCSGNSHTELNQDATILAFGDSLTYGTGASSDKSYPAVLEKLINHNVINAGIPGEISEKALLRLPALINKYQPELIIICHGGNDILRNLDLNETSKNIQKMIDLAQINKVQVMLIGVPKFGFFLKPPAFYQALADKNHIPINNKILPEIMGSNLFKSDHVHPNARGYHLLAENIALTLRKTGALSD